MAAEPKEERVIITLTLDEVTAALLQQEAHEADATVADLAAEMLVDQLARVWGDETAVAH